MNIPKSVNISGIIYKVEFVDKADDAINKFNLYGNIDFVDCKIKIADGMDKQMQDITLIHEVLHGIAQGYSVDLKEDEVERLSNGIYAVLKNNNFKE